MKPLAALDAKGVRAVHVNGWFGAYDKLGMAKRLRAERFGKGFEELAAHLLR